MDDVQRDSGCRVKLPEPGEDATPFLLKCYVKTGAFRPLRDFDLRPVQDEFKLYVWRSATLRDIAGLLHMRDSALSSPTTLHSFRIVYFDTRKNVWAAREAGRGVTRLSRAAFDDILEDVLGNSSSSSSSKGGDEKDDQLFRQTVERVRPQMGAEADEEASRTTLEDLHFIEGDVLDVAIKEPSPSIVSVDPWYRRHAPQRARVS